MKETQIEKKNTGKYRGAAYNICNLEFNVRNEIPAVFHNSSNYYCDFIIKELSKKFEGQFECIRENILSNQKDCNRSRNDYVTRRYLLDYPYFKKHYKLIAINISKQQKLNADPKATQKINFTRNISTAKAATIFFIIEEAEGTVLDFQIEQLNLFDFISF